MPNPLIRQQASAGGKARAKRRLTLERVEKELPRLESLEDAMLRLDRVGLWAASGMLSGSVASAIVRSVEVWIRGHESKLTQDVLGEVRDEVARLEAEFANAPKRKSA